MNTDELKEVARECGLEILALTNDDPFEATLVAQAIHDSFVYVLIMEKLRAEDEK
jgi:hypothetical protein